MTALTDKIISKVSTVLANLGRTVTFDVVTGGTYNPATGKVEGGSTTQHNVTAAPLEYDARYIDGDIIRIGDQRLLFLDDSLGFTPERGQKVTIGSDEWSVVQVQRHEMSAVILVYDVQLRR